MNDTNGSITIAPTIKIDARTDSAYVRQQVHLHRTRVDLTERCAGCQTFRYFDCEEGEDGEAGAGYLCAGCVRRRDGKRRPTDQELKRFLDDPDEIYRLEQRVKDLQVVIASFAESMV